MSSKAQREILIGKQASAGTAVPVDVALRAVANFKAVPDKIMPDEDIGSYAPSRHYIGSLKGEGDFDFDGYYEHAPYPVSMALGEETPTGGPQYSWTWDLPDATANTFALYTMEYTDGVNHIVKSLDVFATGLEIVGEAGQSWMITPELVGANTYFPNVVTGSPTPPATVTPILMAETSLYMDDDYDDIGSTEMDELISFNWKIENLQHQKLFAGSLYPTGTGNDKWETTLELVVEIDNSKIESEKDKLLTTGETAIRIKADNATDSFTIDGMYILQEVDTLDDRDGNNTVKMVYKGQKGSEGDTGQLVISCDLASL